jgi:hypothetical protein
VAFGLCTAFCTQGCLATPDDQSCEQLRDNFERLTGMTTFPCESAGAGGGSCACDCGDDGEVTIADLVRVVLIALGSEPMSTCPHLVGGAHELTIADLIRAVLDALNGCS